MGESKSKLQYTLFTAALLFLMMSASQLAAQHRPFNLEAGNAGTTLREFARQARVDVVMDRQDIQGVQTNAVSGLLEPRAALEQMLKGTELTFNEDVETGAFAVVRFETTPTELSGGNPIDPANANPNQLGEMNNNKNKSIIGKFFNVVLGTALVGTQSISAQVDTTNEQIFELSPFVVQATDTEQYLASSSLAGTRLKTNLSDVGASITAITNVFMEDTDSQDLNDLLIYTANTESAGESGNFSGSSSDAFIFRPQEAQRVRGLSGANMSRDLFRTSLDWDGYNISQVEIVRGASSILFGQGSPAGVINVNLVQPFFRDQNILKFRFDQNDSIRTTLDVNRELIKDKLAIRIVGLYDETKFRQQPSYEDDSRIFATLTYNITKNLTLRANSENARIRASRPNLWAPADGLTDYLNILGPVTDPNPKSGKAYGDPWTAVPADEFRPGRGEVQAVSVGDLFLQWGIAFENDGSLAGSNPIETSFMTILNANAIVANNGVLDRAAYRQWFTKTLPELYGGSGVNGVLLKSFDDYSLYDWKNNNLTGTYSYQNRDFNTLSASLEFLSDERNFGVELAYDLQQEAYHWTSQPGNTIRLDVSEFRFDGTPNPNVLRPAVSVAVGDIADQLQDTEYETIQATAFAKYDFVKDAGWDSFFGRLLGNHTGTLFLSRNTIKVFGETLDETWTGENVSRNASNFLDPGIPFGHNHRGLTSLIYLGGPVSSLADFSITNLGFSRNDIFQNGQVYDVNVWDKESQDFMVYPLTVAHYLSEIIDTKRETDTKAFVLQSNWLDNHIISTIGYREDDLTDSRKVFGFEGDTLAIDPKNYTSEEISGGGDYFSWGIVAKSPRKWNLPLGTSFDVYYSESENFDPAASGRLDSLGRSIDPPTGTTIDYGVRINTFDDKLSVRVNWFETAATLNTFDGSNVGNTLINFDLRFRELFWIPAVQNGIVNPNDPAIDTYGAPPDATLTALNAELQSDGIYTFDNIANTRITDTTDVSAEGVEVEIVFNPTKNWRFIANVSRQETVVANSLTGLQDYIENRLSQWEAVFNYPSNYNQLNDTNTYLGSDGFIDTSMYAPGSAGYNLSFGRAFEQQVMLPLNSVLAQDGSVVSEQRKWRLNLITNYTFSRDSILSGFAIGGAYRWQDAAAIGYPLIVDEGGNLRQDINNPYYGPEVSNLDGWISYGRQILKGRLDWRIQINVRNVFADDDPIPVSIDAFGDEARYRLPPLTTWSITNTFKF